MTAAGDPTGSQPPESAQSPKPSRRRDASAVHEVCPFLASDTGGWRSAYAAREHRCHAVQPPAILAVTKQRELCLVAAHERCATYVAARALAEDQAPVAPGDDGAALWSGGASAPVVLEPARRMGALPTASARSGGQALLVGLMVVAFLVLVIARTQSPAAPPATAPIASPAAASPSVPALVATASPSASAAPSDSAPASPASSASVDATASLADVSPSASAPVTYTVRSGDTLSAIAARYGTTVKRIVVLNAIKDPRSLKVGQVLQIP